MAARKSKSNVPPLRESCARAGALDSPTPIAGIPGPGRWLVADYEPTALFSLKISLATSTVGKTLVVPTPYAIKMALVDAAFRCRYPEADCAALLKSLIPLALRISPGSTALVTHTFVKVRQESRDSDPLRPYTSTIAYREISFHGDSWQWAFDLAAGDDALAQWLVGLLPHISSVGKRGSFIQFRGLSRRLELGNNFTQPIQMTAAWSPPPRAHVVPLDDFGPEADLETLSSFTTKRPKRDKHRRFVDTIVPIGIVNSGPGFTEYRRE
jgi:hypothetical protein